jgi:hypothetical protein
MVRPTTCRLGGNQMSSVRKVYVDCVRGGQVIASYDFAYGETLGPSAPPSHQQFVAGAKENLTSLGVAFPPYAGIEFKVRWA